MVLSRQWKNALYTPILIEYNLRCKSLKNIYGAQMNLDPALNDQEQVLGDSGDEEDDELEEDDVEFAGEEALLLKNSSNLPRQYALKNGSVISDLSASIRARMKGQFMPIASDDILMLNRGAATGVSSRLWDTQVRILYKLGSESKIHLI